VGGYLFHRIGILEIQGHFEMEEPPPIVGARKETMNPTWRKRSACTGIDSDVFYPSSEDDADAEEAKAICAVCPVQTMCLEHALSLREREGIWGGTTERERRRILRQRRKTA